MHFGLGGIGTVRPTRCALVHHYFGVCNTTINTKQQIPALVAAMPILHLMVCTVITTLVFHLTGIPATLEAGAPVDGAAAFCSADGTPSSLLALALVLAFVLALFLAMVLALAFVA